MEKNFLETRALLARGTVLQVGTDTPVAIRMQYVGTGTITSVTVTTATNIVMITSDGGTDTYAFATYDTVGKLVDAINADGIFKAKVLDTVRSEATASQFVTGANAAVVVDGVSYYDIAVDTNAANYFAARLTAQRDFTSPVASHRVGLQEIVYTMDIATAAAGAVKIYDCYKSVETLIYSALSVDTTLTTINFAGGNGVLHAKDGHDLVVKIDDAGTLADAAGNYLRIFGQIE